MENYEPIYYEVRLRLESYNKLKLKLYEMALQDLALKNDFAFCTIKLPVVVKKFNVLRSPHVNKKSKEHYQHKLYRRILVLANVNYENFDVIENFHRFFNEDIAVKVFVNSQVSKK